MIKVSVLYPAGDNATFNMDYYCKRHMPLVQDRLGAACKRIAVEKGLSGAAPDTAPSYIAMGHLYFDSLAEFQTAFAPHATFQDIVHTQFAPNPGDAFVGALVSHARPARDDAQTFQVVFILGWVYNNSPVQGTPPKTLHREALGFAAQM